MIDDLGAGSQRDILKLNWIVSGICIEVETAVAVAAAPELSRAIRRNTARIGFARGSAVPLGAAIHRRVIGESIHRSYAAIIAQIRWRSLPARGDGKNISRITRK